MRAVRYHEHGGPEVLQVEAVPRPTLRGDDDVLVSVGACSVNPLDAYVQRGETHHGERLPAVPGSDFAGTVEAVGDGVSAVSPGDRVLGAGLGFAEQGSYAEFVVVPADQLAPLPETVSFVDGAAIGHVGITAWRSIVQLGNPEPTDYCLVHGGGGGVGHVAVQLAAVVGARAIATAGSPENRRRIEELGAHAALDHGRDDLAEAVLEVAPQGVDVVLDHLPGDYLELDIDVAAPDARIVLLDGYDVRVRNLRKTRRKDLAILNTGALSSVPSMAETLEKLGVMLADGHLEAVVHRTYALEDAAAAQRTLAEESFVGKLVLVP